MNRLTVARDFYPGALKPLSEDVHIGAFHFVPTKIVRTDLILETITADETGWSKRV